MFRSSQKPTQTFDKYCPYAQMSFGFQNRHCNLQYLFGVQLSRKEFFVTEILYQEKVGIGTIFMISLTSTHLSVRGFPVEKLLIHRGVPRIYEIRSISSEVLIN